ncbi:MAG: hypothetical protein ACU0BN_12190 [Sulfitobacter sp.]
MYDLNPKNMGHLHPENCNWLQKKPPKTEATLSANESSDIYAGEIVRVERFRVVAGKTKLHWIIQMQRTSANSKQGITWSGVSYPWDRQSLIAAWKTKTKLPVPDEVMSLPRRFSQFNQS